MRPWRNSFVTRWAVLFASLIMAVVLVSGWLRDRASREYFLQDQRRTLSHRLEVMRGRVQSAIDAVRKDIFYLSSAPAFARLAAAGDGPEREGARREAALHMVGGLQVRPTYFQARLIGVADGGREFIRFDQERGRIREVPAEQLQRKGDRDYFLETVKLPSGRVFISDINLNQEFGKVSEPHIPTLRASTPIFDPAGKLFGIVVVNVDVTTFFEELRALAGPDVAVTLCNNRGDYLLHPDASKCFGFDLGRRYTLFEDHPEILQGRRHGQIEDKQGELSITDEFPFTWESDRSLILRLALPRGPLLALLQAQRAQNFAVTAGLAAIAGAVVIVVTNLFARGLRRVASAVDRYEPGEPLADLPPDSPDEVGLLTRKFRDMAAKISEQMQSLREARQRAEAATRARDEFLATISHEIRTPMNAVLGMAHLLEGEGGGPRQAERLRTLKFAGRQLMALLNNLLDRDRIESGEIVFDRLDFDMGEWLENLHRSLEPLAARKGLVFVLELRPGLPRRVQSDPLRLYQVLNNLAHNAIKFTQHGRVLLQVEPRGGDQVTFRLSDTGPGLPSAVAESLAVGESSIPTTGLGLLISRRLIELLGGRLEAESTRAGTTLSFTLRLEQAEELDARRPAESPPNLADYSALVVEDVPSNRTVLGSLLEKAGMNADFAATAAEARKMLGERKYDFAFVDIQLPDAIGTALASEMHVLRPELRMLAVTAQVSLEIRAACEVAGMKEFLPKPIEPSELYAKLRRLTDPRVESVAQLLDHNQTRIGQYFHQLELEFQTWQTDLRSLIERPDSERLRRLHHRMKNALGQLGLWKLEATLSELDQAMTQGDRDQLEQLGAAALRLLTTARQLTGENRLSTSSR